MLFEPFCPVDTVPVFAVFYCIVSVLPLCVNSIVCVLYRTPYFYSYNGFSLVVLELPTFQEVTERTQIV